MRILRSIGCRNRRFFLNLRFFNYFGWLLFAGIFDVFHTFFCILNKLLNFATNLILIHCLFFHFYLGNSLFFPHRDGSCDAIQLFLQRKNFSKHLSLLSFRPANHLIEIVSSFLFQALHSKIIQKNVKKMKFVGQALKIQCYIEFEKMGTTCQTCTSAEMQQKSTLVLDSKKSYNLEPSSFYNEITREVATKMGPFKYNNDETGQYITKGPIKLENNTTYIGQFENGMKNGRGKQVWEDFSLYEGYWVDDKANGRGRLIHADGSVYEGEWKDDKAHGKGVYHNKDGSAYAGEWFEDVQHGYGIEKWNDGSSYEGNYEAGAKNGKGKFTWKDGSSYEGDFLNNVIEGDGKMIFADGNIYEGDWKDNKMHGKGKFDWTDGRHYEGQYVNDKKEGFGKLEMPDGRVYEGYWKNGVQDGTGKYKNREGSWKEGLWEKGKKIAAN